MIAPLGFIFLGLLFFIWALYMLSSKRFYLWWQNRYWKEPNNKHLTHDSQSYNLVTNIGALMLGITFIVVGIVTLYLWK